MHGLITKIVATAFTATLLTACVTENSAVQESPESHTRDQLETTSSSASTPSESTRKANDCPSTEHAEDIVTYWSIPVGTRDELDEEVFALAFTNALGELVEYADEDADASPCIGGDELFNTLEKWSDLTLKLTSESDSIDDIDQELQEVADLGNIWLETIDRTDLKFSLEPDAADIGN